MGIYAEKRDKLVARIEELTKRIATDTAKKQELEEKLKEANRLAMAEERGCKPRELDDIINAEHSFCRNSVQAVCRIPSCLKWSVSLLLIITIARLTITAKVRTVRTLTAHRRAVPFPRNMETIIAILTQSVRSLKVRCHLTTTDRLV